LASTTLGSRVIMAAVVLGVVVLVGDALLADRGVRDLAVLACGYALAGGAVLMSRRLSFDRGLIVLTTAAVVAAIAPAVVGSFAHAGPPWVMVVGLAAHAYARTDARPGVGQAVVAGFFGFVFVPVALASVFFPPATARAYRAAGAAAGFTLFGVVVAALVV
jgi:hypothetical protein